MLDAALEAPGRMQLLSAAYQAAAEAFA